MRPSIVLLAVLFTTVSVAGAASVIATLGPGQGVVVGPRDEPPCDGVLMLNGDGSWETGWAWEWEGVAPPDFGGFGEGYSATGTVCGMQAYLTSAQLPWGGTGDGFVYASDGLNPANVLSVTVGIEIEDVPVWPEIGVYEIELNPAAVDGQFFVYLWGNWPLAGPHWFFAADTQGTGPLGLPRTKIVPGAGFPEGWQDPSVAFAPTRAMGVGAYVTSGGTPVVAPSWGRIKGLFR